MSMETPSTAEARLTRETWRRFVDAVRDFLASEVRAKALALLAILVLLLLSTSGLNVLNSFVARDFMTAIEHRDRGGFLHEAALYVGVFAASTIAAVIFRFTEERLGLLWREWLTRRSVRFYLSDRSYHRLNLGDGIANPDQRIAEDVRTFVTMTLSLLLMWLNGTLTILAFAGVLWGISRPLFLVGLAYAAAGSLVTVLLGRPLLRLSYAQADREANFRSDLLHVRENADAVALLHGERQLQGRLFRRIDALVENLKRIIAVNRNVGFFTTGYNYMIQIIPALMVAPRFIQGQADFGIITQSAIAFSQLLGAFSLVVTQFQVISSYAAVVARLSALREAMERAPSAKSAGIGVTESDRRLAYERVTLRSPADERPLVRELSLSVPSGARLLVRGDEATAAAALLRATAGMWAGGEGVIVRPEPDGVVFLPERPYLPPGTLREALTGACSRSDDEVREALLALGLEEIVARAGGLDVEKDWQGLLSLREQHLMSVAHVLLTKPCFVFLERIGKTLGADGLAEVLRALSQRGIGCVTIGDGDDRDEDYDTVLELGPEGRWTSRPVRVAENPSGERES
jgi:vitamin B12/bleomycin/antimicrobial peptide transport system ATP-binding/permease protein